MSRYAPASRAILSTMSTTGSLSVKTGARRRGRSSPAAAPIAGPQPRSSTYRGASRDAAAKAYVADAQVMARMGYVSDAEVWSTELEHVLSIRYVHAPDRVPAALEAVARAAATTLDAPPEVPSRVPDVRATLARAPIEARLGIGVIGGLFVGLALGLILTVVSGQSADLISLGGFGLIGSLLGLIGGVSGD